jgi:subtilisin-like proprotein convertase family protein
MRQPLFCPLLVILLVTASASALTYGSADPTSFVEDHFEGYAPKGESRYHEILVPENASELFIEILSVSGELVGFELKDPKDDIVEEGQNDYMALKVNRPVQGPWTLKITGQGDSSNRYLGLAITASGESSGTITRAVKKDEIELAEIEVGEDVGSLSLDFKTLSEDDLKITLTSPLGKEVWTTTSHRPDEVRSETVDYPIPGTWKVEVRGTNVKESGRFEIAWNELSGHQIWPIGEGTIDLLSGGDFSGQVEDGEICTYSLEVPAGAGYLAFGLSALTDDDLKASLYNPLGEEVWIATSHTPDQTISTGLQFPMPGEWTIEVLGSGVKSSGRYSGWVEILDGPLPISSGTEVSSDLLIGYVGDEDEGREYTLNVPEDSSTLTLEFRSLSDDDLKVLLFSPDMKQIWSATSPNSDQVRSKTITNPMAGDWTLGVLGPGLKESGLYLAQVTLAPVSFPTTPSAHLMEGEISRGDVVDHTILVPEDVDMLFVYAACQGGDLELRLLNPSGIEVDRSSSDILTVTAPLPGTWTLKAVGTGGEGPGDYQIRVWMPAPDELRYGQ